MKIHYSCVVGEKEIFKKQGQIWLDSLITLGKIDPGRIYVHCISGTDAGYIKKIKETGANVDVIEPFGDLKYCNKIPQLSNAALKTADITVLMDTDMIMLENFERELEKDADFLNCISGKIVDLANPPIEVIAAVFFGAALEKKLPDHKIECGEDLTYGANFNGGLYIIPAKYYGIIETNWKKWAKWLLKNGKPLYDAGKEAHIDQVSFCMAVHEFNLDVKYLDRNYNYPLPYDFGGRDTPYVLHYHDKVDENFMLVPGYEPSGNIKKAVKRANEFILFSCGQQQQSQ
ncbi:MAG: hypothetical protein FWH24_06160 [Oscillospiraceae bacterium]|nr:hypothetical protein [Oscillospiraceae bacterium]